MKVTYTTKSCPMCGKISKLKLDKESYDKWKAGTYVQVAFSQMGEDDRELLISGTHPECWPFSDDED